MLALFSPRSSAQSTDCWMCLLAPPQSPEQRLLTHRERATRECVSCVDTFQSGSSACNGTAQFQRRRPSLAECATDSSRIEQRRVPYFHSVRQHCNPRTRSRVCAVSSGWVSLTCNN